MRATASCSGRSPATWSYPTGRSCCTRIRTPRGKSGGARAASSEPRDEAPSRAEVYFEQIVPAYAGAADPHRRGVLHLIGDEQRRARAAAEERERDVEGPGRRTVRDHQEPLLAMPPSKPGGLADLAER